MMGTRARTIRLGEGGRSGLLVTVAVLTATLGLGFAPVAPVATAGAAVAAPAASSSTVLFTQSFEGTTAQGFSTLSIPDGNGHEEAPCLLQSGATTTVDGRAPVRCLGDRRSEDESGLRLTREVSQDAGGVFHDEPVPLSSGLDVTFDARQHTMQDHLAGDGMALVLAIAPPGPSTVPARLGQPGRSLGYAEDTAHDPYTGLPRTWLGFGLDVVGSHRVADCVADGVTVGGFNEPALTVRGPGTGRDGYCLRGSAPVRGLGVEQDFRRAPVRTTAVPAEVAINPSGQNRRTASGHEVPAGHWLFVATPYDTHPSDAPGNLDRAPVVLTGPLPSVEDLAALDIPSSWLDGNGLPRRLSVGWTASTGGIRSTQQLSNVRATTLAATAPTFETDLLTPDDGRLPVGETSTVRLAPRVSAFADAPVDGELTTSVTLPDGAVPATATWGTKGCTVEAPAVSCSYTPSGPLDPGTALPELAITLDVDDSTPPSTGVLVARVSSGQRTSSDSFVLTLGNRTQRITGFDLPATGMAGETLALSASGGTSGKPVEYQVEGGTGATPACTVSGTTLTLTRQGTCTVLADQVGDERHDPARQLRRSMLVSPGTPVAALTVPTTAAYGSAVTATLTVTPAGTGTAQLTVDGSPTGSAVDVPVSGTVGLPLPRDLEPGGHAIGASFASSDWEAHDTFSSVTTSPQTLTVTKLTQSIALSAPGSGKAGETVAVSATGGASGQPVELDVADGSDAVCRLTADGLALLRRGSCLVTASQAGDAHHEAAPSESTTVAVGLAPTTTTLTLPATATSGDSVPVQVTTTSGVAGTVTVLVDDVPSTTVAAAATGSTSVSLTDLAVGTRSVRATFVPTSTETHGESSSMTSTVTVGLASQTIDLVVAARGRAGDRLSVTATGGASGNPVVLGLDASSDGGACALDGSRSGATLRLLGAGSCVVRAEQAGGPRHSAAPAVVRTVVVESNATATSLELAAASTRFGTSTTALARVTDGVSGSVQFAVDGATVGPPVTVASGLARSGVLTGPSGAPLGVGRHSVTATFRPDFGRVHAWSSSIPVTLVVEKVLSNTTTSVEGADLVATVRAAGDGLGTPTGRVTFTAGGRSVGTADLAGGVARLARPSGATGEVVAAYGGDAVFAPSAGGAVREPLITASVTSRRPASDAGWYRTPVVVTFTCTVATAPLSGPCPAPVVLGEDGADQSVARSIVADDGARASVTVSGIDVDRTRPEVAVRGVRGGHLYRRALPRGRCRATDALSGVATCTLERIERAATVVYVARAVDRAGNRSSTRVVVRTAR